LFKPKTSLNEFDVVVQPASETPAAATISTRASLIRIRDALNTRIRGCPKLGQDG
jgi:hypothetical protein